MPKKAFVAAATLVAASMAQATCYSVYKADGTLVHQGSNAPVNLALPIGDSVAEKYGPGASMTVSDLGVYCKDAREEIAARAGTGAPARAAVQPEALAIKTLAAPGKDAVSRTMQ